MSMQDQIRKEIEKSSLDDSIQRIESLIAATEAPRPLHLGILLALRIGKEMRDGKAPGTDSAALVAGWSSTHSGEVIDEAVVFARHFLLKPQELVAQLASRLDETRDDSGDQAEEDALVKRYRDEDENGSDDHSEENPKL